MKLTTSRGITVACCTTLLVSATNAVFYQKLRIRNVGFALLCCAVLMVVAAPARADVCTDAGAPAACGVTITISGTSGNLSASIVGGGPTTAYDSDEDQLVGILNTSSVKVGAIVLSAPLLGSNNLFQFESPSIDGPCDFFVN